MSMSAYESGTFLFTVLKQIEESLWSSKNYIGTYFLSILLFSVRLRNDLASRKLKKNLYEIEEILTIKITCDQ